jgi:EmrB/QacA subfamily drug resistance transporter
MTKPNEKSTKTWVLALASVASLMIFLDAMVVTTALSTIRQDLGTSIEALEWTVNAYNLSFAVLLLTGAALGDRLGRRRMMAAGLTLFVAASIACALSTGVGWLIAARAVQGAGAALVIPLAMTLIGAVFPREERGKALGIFSSVSGLALIAGPAIGGAIAQGLAWQWIFWINVPIGALVIPLVLARIPESFGPPARLDIPGLALVTGAALGVVWGLMRGNAAGWTSLEVVASLAAGIVLAAAFVGFELRARDPMVPMRLFRSRALSAGIAASFLFYAAMYGVLFFLPQFLQVAQGHTPLGTGLRLLTWTATLLVFAPIGGALVNRLGEKPLVVGGVLLQGIGFGWIAAIAAPDLAYMQLVAPLILAGGGVSMAMPAAQNAILGAVAPNEVGKPPAPSTCCAISARCSASRSWSRCSRRRAASAVRRRSVRALSLRSASARGCRSWPRSQACGCRDGARSVWYRQRRRRDASTAQERLPKRRRSGALELSKIRRST